MTQLLKILCAVAALASLEAAAADDGSWENVSDGGRITLKMRSRPGVSAKEVWAEGEIKAPVQDVQSAVMEVERLATFMPHVKESRYVGAPEADGSRYVYARLELPVLSSRDYVLRVYLDKSVGPDGKGEFKNHWQAVNDKIPSRSNVIRLKLNEGSWHVKPMGDGTRCWAAYRLIVDPGGWVPGMAAEWANKSGVTGTFEAVEKEAQKRHAARKAELQKSAASPASLPRAEDSPAVGKKSDASH
jgi:hypothetical protein